MTAALRFDQLTVRSFRNIAALTIEPAPRLNVITGDNGQGKTSLLEALYVLATSKSFRAERVSEVIRHGDEQAVVSAKLMDGGLAREQRAAVGARGRSFTLDGKRPERVFTYATRTPIVVFHPGDLTLVSGPASGRRTLLDRIALFLNPSSADHRQRYTRALRERQKVLDERGAEAKELAVFETLLAEHGSAFSRARREAAEALTAALTPAFTRMAPGGLSLATRFEAGGTEDRDAFRAELEQRRWKDARRGAATFGPQRDDLALDLDTRSARRHASQGQQRLLALSLKVAELDCVRQVRGAHPVLLLDDVSSELDPNRTGAVYHFLADSQSQVFVTTARPDLLLPAEIRTSERADFRLRAGALDSL